MKMSFGGLSAAPLWSCVKLFSESNCNADYAVRKQGHGISQVLVKSANAARSDHKLAET